MSTRPPLRVTAIAAILLAGLGAAFYFQPMPAELARAGEVADETQRLF